MPTHIVIPARLESQRFPSKLLATIERVPVLARTIVQARGAGDVIVATDAHAIATLARDYGAEVEMTSTRPINGTERCAEVAALRGWDLGDYVINWQGDAPFVPAGAMHTLVAFMKGELEDGRPPNKYDMVTVHSKVTDDELGDRNTVKLAFHDSGPKLGTVREFSRWRIRGGAMYDHGNHKHYGIYLYTVRALLRFAAAGPCTEELVDGLEQLRALRLGFRIGSTLIGRSSVGPEINTPADIKAANEWCNRVDVTTCDSEHPEGLARK